MALKTEADVDAVVKETTKPGSEKMGMALHSASALAGRRPDLKQKTMPTEENLSPFLNLFPFILHFFADGMGKMKKKIFLFYSCQAVQQILFVLICGT